MKNCLPLMLLVMLLASTTTITKAQSFTQGEVAISAGYGFPNLVGAAFSAFKSEEGYTRSGFGPIYFKAEYGIADNIGLGLNFAYAANKVTYTYGATDTGFNTVVYHESISRTTMSLLARFNYHFGDSENWDPYVGLGIGYRNARWVYSSDEPGYAYIGTIPNFFPLGMEITVGCRYFFGGGNVGIYAEVGTAKSLFQGGLVARFGN